VDFCYHYGMTPISVLYDGWALVHQPTHPAALHLLALLENLPAEVQATLALPGPAPDWLPPGLAVQVIETSPGSSARLGWEQRRLPALARQVGAEWLHSPSGAAPLLGRQPAMALSPTHFEADEPRPRGLAERLRRSLAQGGQGNARAVFWPADLPPSRSKTPLRLLPPVVSALFAPSAAPQTLPGGDGDHLPESFLLYHGPGSPQATARLLDAWFWAASSVGSYTPLIMAGLSSPERARMKALLAGTTAAESVLFLTTLPPAALAEVYRRCTALVHTAAEPAWGGPIRHALACGKPVVACNDPRIEALVGPAAYLAPAEDSRLLGAALITVVVEQNVAEGLAQAAMQRAAAWSGAAFAEKLSESYR